MLERLHKSFKHNKGDSAEVVGPNFNIREALNRDKLLSQQFLTYVLQINRTE
jgi:hypothetical protein